MSVPFSSGVGPSADVMFQTVGDEAVILNLKTSLYLGLDAVGTRMWTLLTSAASIQSAYDSLLEEYEVFPEQLRADLEEFLDKLSEQGLIEAKPAGAPAASPSEKS